MANGYICGRVCHWAGNRTWYVSDLPGHGGVDYGWAKTWDKAHTLTFSQMRRFRAYMLSMGETPLVWSVHVDRGPRLPIQAVTE